MTAPNGSDPVVTLLLAGLDPGQQEAVRRCAVMALFDQEAYDAALRPEQGPELDVLIGGRLVEPLSGVGTGFRVRPALLDAAWASWFPHGRPDNRGHVPAALRGVARAVVRHCAEHGRNVEQLRALLLVDRRAARTLFRRAFDECDRRLDLAGCANLLDVLSDPSRRPFVGTALAADREDRSRRLAARTRWRTAFYSSDPSRYLPRVELEERLEALLSDAGPRLLRITGSGGRGKSTMLRWFLARRCVDRRIPCALVDLDRPLDPVNATRHPWLLLLEIAHQLDDQMSGGPFRALLHDYGAFRQVLYVGSGGDRAGATALGTSTGAAAEGEIVSQFFEALVDSGAPHPIVVIDTVEEALLRPDADTFIALLDRLRRETGLRIVVSGRGTANEGRLAPDADIEVPPFTAEQSRRYLLEVRGVQPDLVDVIVHRAGGLPWQLALWGDVVAAHPYLTPAMLDQVQAEAAWVVDRIVGRIESVTLQWLVRYGVLPRRLHRDFAEQVLLPRIASAVRGSDDDRPEQDSRPPGGVPVFETAVDLPRPGAEFADTWQQLVRYASTTSWLRLAEGDEGAVVFQPELRRPVLELIAAQPVGVLLHRDAVTWFERLAADDPDRWATWTCEAVYHRFRSGAAGAAGYWRDALTTARQSGLGGDTSAQIASEVIGPEYVDDEERPIIDEETLAAAHAELAWAQCRIALRHRLPPGHATWSTVEANLADAQKAGSDPGSELRRRSAQAALDLARGRIVEAADELGSLAADGGVTSVDRCIVLLLLAQAQVVLASARQDAGLEQQARETLREAATVADGLGVGEVSARIAVAVAEGAAALGRLDEATDGLRRTIAEHPALGADVELRRTIARCALDSGHPATALGHVAGGRLDPELGPLTAEAQLSLGDAVGAIRTCTELLTGLVEPARRAAVLAQRGRAHAGLFLVDLAVDDLVAARAAYAGIGDIEGVGSCTTLVATVMLRDVGNLLEAQQYVDEAAMLPLDPGSPAWSHSRLLGAELQHRRGERDSASRTVLETLDVVNSRCTDPRRVSDVALAGFCWSSGLEIRIRGLLRTNLAQISPDTSRLAALTALPECPPWGWGRHLLKLALPTGREWERPESADTPWLQLLAADLMRVAGRTADATALLTAATDAIEGRTLLAGITWLQFARRIGGPGLAEHRVARMLPDDDAYPMLAAAQRLLLAERRLDADEPAEVAALLDTAEVSLAKATTRATSWKSKLHLLRDRIVTGPRVGSSREWLLREATRRELGHLPQTTVAEHPEPPEPGSGEHTLVIAMSGDTLVMTGGAGQQTLHAAHPLVSALLEESRTTGRSPVVSWVRGRTTALEGLLPLDGIVPAADTDVTLVADPRTAQLPWELATIGGARLAGGEGLRTVLRVPDQAVALRTGVRMLQESLVRERCSPGPIDGLHGPQTAAALRSFQEQRGIAADGSAGVETWKALRDTRSAHPPTALVVQNATSAADPVAAYRRQRWTVASAIDVDLSDLDALLPAGPVDVVHIVATMQVTGAVPVLGFAPERDPAGAPGPGTMACTLVDSLVHELARRGTTPLVLLEIAPQPRLGSAVRQLLLRNEFAHQLLALGQCYAVVAFGPARRDGWKRTVAAVTGSVTAAELARELQSTPPDTDDVLPNATTALFTSLVADRMPRLGTAHGQGRRRPS